MPFKYVVTDFTQANIDFWKGHPSFQPLLAAGLVDFALFNAESDDVIKLQVGGEVLSAETLANPVIAICNYVFDTLCAVSSLGWAGQYLRASIPPPPPHTHIRIHVWPVCSARHPCWCPSFPSPGSSFHAV